MSIYELISSSLNENGALPETFSLPKQSEENKLSFADGALDGMYIYHMAHDDCDIAVLKKVVTDAANEKYEAARNLLEEFFMNENNNMLKMVDSLQQWIIENRNTIPAGNLYQFSMDEITNSTVPGAIKFGMSVLELINNRDNEYFRNVIRTMSLSDEFTLFGLYIIRGWEDANDVIFDIAKKVKGWGRIHAVELLLPESEEIKRWLFFEGCKNDVVGAYSALTVAQKIEFEKVLLKGAFSDKEYDAAGELMQALTDEGPVWGISAMDNRAETVETYCGLSDSENCTEGYYLGISALATYFDGKNDDSGENERLKRICRNVLESERCHEHVKRYVLEGHGFSLAKELGIECEDAILLTLDKDFVSNYYLMAQLSLETAIDKMIALTQRELPLKDMATGVQDAIWIKEGFQKYMALSYMLHVLQSYPGKGEDIVISGLAAPLNNCRNAAVTTLNEWKRLGYVLSEDMACALKKLKETEMVDSIREKLLQI